jgi:hypothetical protein
MQIIIGIVIGIIIATVGLGGVARVLDKGVDMVKNQSKELTK